MISQLRTGALEFFSVSGTILSVLVPVAAIGGVGFAFPDYPAFWKAMDGSLGRMYGADRKVRHPYLDRLWDNGFRQITSAQTDQFARGPKGIEDSRADQPAFVSMFKAFEASPTSINFGEVYTALQTTYRRRPGKPTRDHLDRQALRGTEILLADEPHRRRLLVYGERKNVAADADRFRDIIARNINEAALLERQDIATLNESIVQTLEKQGLVFNRPKPSHSVRCLERRTSIPNGNRNSEKRPGAVLESNTGKLS